MEGDCEKNSIAPFVTLIASKYYATFFLLFFFLWGAVQGHEYIPLNWSPVAIHLYVVMNLIIVLIYVSILANCKVLDAGGWISKTTNVNCYDDLTSFDAVLAHYGNVATVGLFIGVLIYGGRQFADDYPRLIALFATLLIFLVFGLYAVLMSKMCMRLSKKKENPSFSFLFSFIFRATIIFLVDVVAIRMFIEAVPKISSL